jgi:cytochrome d ubiquinol oxidase subunit I
VWIVAGAAVLSAYTILAANSWMQHPVGYTLVDGHAQLTNIVPVLFNVNVGLTTAHVLAGSLVTGSVLVLAVAAWHLLRRRDTELFAPVAAMALRIGLVAAIASATFGHLQGVLALQQQPMKMAAAEALYDTESPAGLSLFALAGFAANPGDLLVDVKLPFALSVLNDLSTTSTVRGIDDLQAASVAQYGPGDYVPIVGLMYWSFRSMVGSGSLLIAVMAFGCWLAWRGRLEVSRRFLRVAIAAVALPFVAQAGGWILREGGRQPWIVEGLLRTDAANSANVGVWAVGLSLGLYLAFYAVTFLFAGRTLLRELGHGVEGEHTLDSAAEPGRRSSSDLALTY